jgi:hypothetical protein
VDVKLPLAIILGAIALKSRVASHESLPETVTLGFFILTSLVPLHEEELI